MPWYQWVSGLLAQERVGTVGVKASENANQHPSDPLARKAGGYECPIQGVHPVAGSPPLPTEGPNKAGAAFYRDKQRLPFATVQPVSVVAAEPLGDLGRPAEMLGVRPMDPSDLSPSFRSPQFYGRSASCRSRLRWHSVNPKSRLQRPKAPVTYGHVPHGSGVSIADVLLTRHTQHKTLVRALSNEAAVFGRFSAAAAQGIANRLMSKGCNLDRIERTIEFGPFGFQNTRSVVQSASVAPK